MRILLTGGAGYVGSACLRRLMKNGHDPIAFDNLAEGNAEAVPQDRLVVGDLDDREHLTDLLCTGEFEAVMHFAAVASVPESIHDPDTYYRVNVQGTKNVLDAMRRANLKRLIVSSTAATFSFAAAMPLDEDSPQKPEVPYGTTKLAAEWMIKDYSRAYGLGYAIFRYFNASGADLDGQHGESRRHESHLIPLIFAAALGKRPAISVFGTDYDTPDGTCVRDYVHVDDIAQAHERAMQQISEGQGRSYNLGSGTGATVLQVLKACEKVFGGPIPHQLVARRPGDPGTLIASPRRAIEELGWKLTCSDLETIVSSAWRWHSAHPNGYGEKKVVRNSRANGPELVSEVASR
ncbi:UDP-glucose 4-epimerase GalE [Anatilimnocola aggregata]|uniref:UDP-glucose 4-epimerase GalE n=1 Tax=Anatilimnocola aggregata TaxID=2528021 RepID=UPI00119D8B64|nr:UDP-glucose 4-epimerase GalE [Anatilimnocola aggregata]